MARRGFKDSKAFTAASEMPAGKKHQPHAEFSWSESEVVKWLISTDDILGYLFNKAKESGAIEYDPETGTWRGCDSSSQVENL